MAQQGAGNTRTPTNTTDAPYYSWDATKGSTPASDVAALELMARKINQPGKIQDSGFLLGVDIQTGCVRACSKNCQAFLLAGEEEILGQPLGSLFKCEASELASIQEKVDRDGFSTRMTLLKKDLEVDVTWSRTGDWMLVEVEEGSSPAAERDRAALAAASAQARAAAKRTEHELHSWLVSELQHASGFDRVKVYKFFAGQHGEVVAEALRPDSVLESCLHRSYPATDTPQRARDLFLINPIRYISDTAAEQVEVVCVPGFEASGISLASCGLRAVHPCHLEYLQNMRARASLTFAIVIKNKLWGLLCCHHSQPVSLARCVRSSCWHLAQMYIGRLAALLEEQMIQRAQQLERVKVALQAELSPADGKNTTTRQIEQSLRTFCRVVNSQGFAFVTTGHTSSIGMVPDEQSIRRIEAVLNTSAKPGVFDANSLAPLLGDTLNNEEKEQLSDVGGVLAVRCVRGCTLMWFRQQETRKVQWGGRELVMHDAANGQAGMFRPRQSFADWTEKVEGTCKPWTEDDEQDAVDIGMALDRRWFHDTQIERLATSPDGKVLEWNAPLAKLVCMSAERAGGKELSSLCYACEKQDVEDMLARFRSDDNGEWTAHLNIFTQESDEGPTFNVWRRDNTVSKEVLVFEIAGSDAVSGQPRDRREEIARPVSVFHMPQDVGMMDELPMPLWVMDCTAGSCTYLWANKAALAVFGCTLNEFLCLDLKSDWLDWQSLSLWHSKVQQQQQRLHCRQTFYGKTVAALDLVISPVRVQTVQGVQVLCLVAGKPSTNETENLRSNELLQASKVMMMLFSPGGDLITANIAARVYYSMATGKRELSLDDVFESSCWDSEKERRESYDKMMAVVNSNLGKTFEIERYKMHPKVGVVHQIQFSSARDPTTGALAISVNETDISGLKQVQDELVAAKLQQERFLAATSHELRTPLHAILALSDNLIRNNQVVESGMKMIKIIQSSGQQLASLVNDILDAAAIHAGALVLKHELIQLHLLVSNVIDAVQPLAPRTVQMINDVPESIPVLEIDSARLQQILINLLGNAVKFTRQGEIRVSAEMRRDELVAIAVVDTGRGIPEEKLKAIWEAFQQVEPAAQSTGLGLTIVRSLVEAMGGLVEVESRVQEDTRFTIILPRSPQHHAQKKPSAKGGDAEVVAEAGRALQAAPDHGKQASWGTGMLSGAVKREEERSAASAVELRLTREVNETLARLAAREEELLALKSAHREPAEPAPATPPPVPEQRARAAPERSRRCLYVTGEGEVEEGQRRLLEMLGCNLVLCSPGEAQYALSGQQPRPELVLVDGREVQGPGQVRERCGWLRALKDPSIPVLLLSWDAEADLEEALECGCTGAVGLPLAQEAVQAALLQQRDLKRLWQWRPMLRSRADPFPELRDVAARAAELAEREEVVREHPHLAIVNVQLEVGVAGDSAQPLHSAAQLVWLVGQLLESKATDVAALADKYRALVAEARGDSFTLVVGLDGEAGARQPLHAAAFSMGCALLQAMGRAPEGEAVLSVSARVGVSMGVCHEAAMPVQRASQRGGSVAFFGAPCVQAAALAASAAPGHLVLEVGVFKGLFPNERADAVAYSYSIGPDTWAAHSIHGPPRPAKWPGPAPPPVVPHLVKNGGAGGEAAEPENFQQFAAAFCRLERAAAARQQLLGGHGLAAVDMQLVSLVSAKIGSLALDAPAPALSKTSAGCAEMAVSANGGELLSQASVLSVDDSPVNQIVMESILRPLVKKMGMCMDGPEALKLMEGGADLPDIILLDVMLPTSSGVQVCRTLRERFSPTQLPIVLVSGKSSKDSIVQGLEAGANDYIIKPFDSAELISRVTCQLKMVANVNARLEHTVAVSMHKRTLPPSIVERIGRSEPTELVDELQSASVLCCSVVGYKRLAAAESRAALNALASLYSGFDSLCTRSNGWALDSAGDCYMVLGGQDGTEEEQMARLVQMGLDMLEHARSIAHPTRPGSLEVSVTINTGRASAGVRACKAAGGMLRYCVHGEAGQMARSLQHTSAPMTVTLSARSRQLLHNQFPCVSLGKRKHSPRDLEAVETFVVQDAGCAWELALAESRAALSLAPIERRLSDSPSPPSAPPHAAAPPIAPEPAPAPAPEPAPAPAPAPAAPVAAPAAPAPEANPLEMVLRRAKLPDLLESLLAEKVDVDCLANATDEELDELGIKSVAARSRIRRCANAWLILFS